MANKQPTKRPKRSNYNQNQPPKRSFWNTLFWLVTIGLIGYYFFMDKDAVSSQEKALSYTKLTAYVEQNMVSSVVVYDDSSVKVFPGETFQVLKTPATVTAMEENGVFTMDIMYAMKTSAVYEAFLRELDACAIPYTADPVPAVVRK